MQPIVSSREGLKLAFRLIKAMLFPPSRERLRVFLRFNRSLFKFLLDFARNPDKVFWDMMEEASNFQEDLANETVADGAGDTDELSRILLEVAKELQPLFTERLIPYLYELETTEWVQATLEQDSAQVYASIYKRIRCILEGHNKPLFVPFTIPHPDAQLIEYLLSGDAVSTVELIEGASLEHVLSLIPDNNALVHLFTTDNGTFGIITQKDVPPEIILFKSFTRQRVENLLRGWMWLYYWHKGNFYDQAIIQAADEQRTMSQEELEKFKEAYKRIPYELLFHNQALFDRLQPTEIPASGGIPAIPFPSWLVMEAILRELGKGDLVSGEGLWQRLDEKLYPRGIRRIILCPDKAFALFPHHGAILEIGRDGQKECLLDRYEIVYLPQGTFAQAASAKQRSQLSRLLIFGTDGEALFEVGIANLRTLLPDHINEWHANEWPWKWDEGREKLAADLSRVNAMTFLGHGEYNWEQPSESYLGLLRDRSGNGYDDLIRLEELVEKIPPQIDLITLAGCETGLPKITAQVSDYKGFAEDLFSRRSVSTVISTLWPVQQISTVLLLRQFHQYWLLGDSMTGEKSLPPVKALRKAQLWFRMLTREQAIAELETLASVYSSDEIAKEIQTLRDGIVERPYAHPYFWSTFYVMGGIQ